MNIVVSSQKGGCGKTTISVLMAMHKKIDGYIVTNDDQGLFDKLFPETFVYQEKVKVLKDADRPVIYDFGGFGDGNLLKVVKKADVVLVPTLSSLIDLKVLIDTVAELLDYNENIIVIHNRSREEGIVEDVISENFGDDVMVLTLRNSKGIDNAAKKGMSFYDYANRTPLSAVTYGNILGDLEKITDVVLAHRGSKE